MSDKYAALKARIEKALEDFTNGRASMHVPVLDTDVDLVLYDCLELLAERDADRARIAELEREKDGLESVALALRDDTREARTLTVKLPESVIDAICHTAAEIHNQGRGVSDERAQDIINSIRCAAGISLKIEGE